MSGGGRGVDRVDKGRGPFEKDHVHFGDGERSPALNHDGTWKHNPQEVPGESWLDDASKKALAT